MKAVRWDEIPDEEVRPGVRRRGFGTEDVLLVLNECEPGMDLRPHSHDFDQLAMIVSGTARYHVGDVANEVGPGSVLLVNKRWRTSPACPGVFQRRPKRPSRAIAPKTKRTSSACNGSPIRVFLSKRTRRCLFTTRMSRSTISTISVPRRPRAATLPTTP